MCVHVGENRGMWSNGFARKRMTRNRITEQEYMKEEKKEAIKAVNR